MKSRFKWLRGLCYDINQLELVNRVGALADTAPIFKDLGLYLVSVVTLPQEEGKMTRDTVFRVRPTNEKKLREVLSKVGPPVLAVK